MKDLPTKRTAFVVLGMHRSGTSSVAGVLALLGATPPRTLMGPKPENPKGFWESEVLMAFNDEILTRAGSAWDDPAPLDQGVFDGPQGDDLRRRAREKLDEEFGGADTIVIKDPRICRFYPFWREALLGRGYEPFVILPLRDPAEVAASLAARNGMPMADGLRLWRAYVTDAEQATRDHPRKAVTWRHLFEDWRSIVSTIGAMSGVVFAGDEEEVDRFLSPHLSTFVSADILPIDAEYRSIYDNLRG